MKQLLADYFNRRKIMKDRKKRKQREEVRRILKAIRDELAAHRLQYEDLPEKQPPVAIGEVIAKARAQARGSSAGRV